MLFFFFFCLEDTTNANDLGHFRIHTHTRLAGFSYQGESGDGEQRFEAAVDEERAEEPQAVVPQVLERQLEDVSPADAAEVDLLRRPVRGAAQRQELWMRGFGRQHSERWVSGGGAECLCSAAFVFGATLQ